MTPTLPKNIKDIIVILPASDKCEVTPVEIPTVENAEVASNIMSPKEIIPLCSKLFSVIESAKVPKKMNKTANKKAT